jgi:hypothetical protein
MLYSNLACSPGQERLIRASERLFLGPEDQVNFHFMSHMRNLLRAPDFMEGFEDELLERKFEQFQREEGFADLDYRESFIPIPTFTPDELGREAFQARLNDPRSLPVVIKGLISGTRALDTWSHEYLAGAFGDVRINALEFDNDGSYQALSDDASRNLTLSQIVRGQLSGNRKDSYYINNSAQVFNEFPELVGEIGGDRALELFRGHAVNTFSQLFVGNTKTWGTNWHQGNDLSCALMINGVKRWYFIDPRLVYIMRPYLNGPNGMMTKGEVRHSLDFQRVQNPLYAFCPKFYVDLEPGDALAFTKYWPHAVINQSRFQIMATLRLTEADLDSLSKGHNAANLLPVFDNVLDSDPDFIKFKYEIFQGLGRKEKRIGDEQYFAGFAKTRD